LRTLTKKDVDGSLGFLYTLYMMNAHTEDDKMAKVVNSNGKSIAVDAQGWALCDDCGGEYHPDDMKNDRRCFTCHNDIHCDDWTMDDI
jgi:predicted Zn-ribbon and HTH transcriptional regulator